jgi:phosphoribosylformimino-5-aminoimidazole carboxamide ribotide isomerase
MSMPDIGSVESEFTRCIVYPAIDLRGGKVVRLAQGDPTRQTIYGDDPVAAAARWKEDGAEWLHVINLDGAFGEDTALNEKAVRDILRLGLRVQFGGGLRDAESISHAMQSGVARAVIGTAAIENPALLDWALANYPAERIAVGIDARDGMVRVHGWTQGTSVRSADLGRRVVAQGARWCVFTDIARDGSRIGINVEATAALARETGLNIIASGGVASLEDVRLACAAKLHGVVIGRALYDGSIALRDALSIPSNFHKGSQQ